MKGVPTQKKGKNIARTVMAKGVPHPDESGDDADVRPKFKNNG
jgi:hypothetical protein